jgi:hypothetical protein
MGKLSSITPARPLKLDGILPRPNTSWTTPASDTAADYAVGHILITQAYLDWHASRVITDPNLPVPVVPMGTPYPVDQQRYIVNRPLFAD